MKRLATVNAKAIKLTIAEVKNNDDFKDQLQKFIKDYITDEEDG